jgi:hypothetical protein
MIGIFGEGLNSYLLKSGVKMDVSYGIFEWGEVQGRLGQAQSSLYGLLDLAVTVSLT